MLDLTALFSDIVQRIYSLLDQAGLSVAGFLIVGALFSLALLFGFREAVTWFFKIDDIKKDLRRIRDSLNEVEGELRTLQTVYERQRAKAGAAAEIEVGPETTLQSEIAKPAPVKSPSFPIAH
ncbi:MAG: hypothetical protein V4692_00725 [Bdellovibrionota bacterium]